MTTIFHSSHIHVPRHRGPTALRTFVTSSSFGRAGKEPFRRGVLFTTIAGGLLLIGGILTWLGFNNDLFGGKSSMTGPLLIALSILLLLFSARQFIVAKKCSANQNTLELPQPTQSTVTAMVIDGDDGVGAVTVVMDTVELEPPPARFYSNDYAPPSYIEVTQRSNSNTSSLPQNSPSEADYEPPPSYEETVQATVPTTIVPQRGTMNSECWPVVTERGQ
ncbi:hypothetical protein ScPMuIL_014520 [Solemya velum]